jgi:hypothetical protein
MSHQGLIEIFSNWRDLLRRVAHQRSTAGVHSQRPASGSSATVHGRKR